MEIVSTTNAPEAIGPYSQATVVGDMVFTAGQIALDPATMQLVDGGVAEQTERVFANLAAVLEAAGSSLANVVKTTVYLADMADFPAMNEIYAQYSVCCLHYLHSSEQPSNRRTAAWTFPRKRGYYLQFLPQHHHHRPSMYPCQYEYGPGNDRRPRPCIFHWRGRTPTCVQARLIGALPPAPKRVH